MLDVFIRKAALDDSESIRRVHLAAFPDTENAVVSSLAVDLLAEGGTINLVAIDEENRAGSEEGNPIAHAAFSPVQISGSNTLKGTILAPLGILPSFQKQGVGSKLIEHGREVLQSQGVHLLFVYGDPAYYSRFGFTNSETKNFTPPYNLEYPFGWQVLILNECQLDNKPLKLSCVNPLCDPELW